MQSHQFGPQYNSRGPSLHWAMPPPRGDVTVLFLGPPGSGKSALIAALCDRDVETVEIPDGRPDSGLPSLRAAGPGLFLGELSCPPAEPGPWTPLLAVRNLRPEESQNEAQARDQTAALLDSAGLGAAALFVPRTDCLSTDGCEELERLRAALRSQAEALQRLLPPAQDGFEVLGAAELEAVREAFETGGLEAALSWVRAGLERLGSARLDLAVAGRADVGLVLDVLLGLDPEDPGAVPAAAPAGPTPYPAPERPNVVLWSVPLGSADTTVAPYPTTHYDALILVTPGAPTEKDWAQVRPLVLPDTPLVCVRTDGEGEDPESLEEEEKAEKSGSESLENPDGEGFETAHSDGKENRGPRLQKGGSGEGSEEAGTESLQPVGVSAKKSGSGDSERAAALSPEDETWEALDEMRADAEAVLAPQVPAQ
ncbi:hypothetical protein K5549_015157 [Capra hircus]|nr:hypothetical protein K5549_015157 [Capra hircus]